MKTLHYPQVGETLYTEQLENGLHVIVSRRPGFRKAYAFLAVNYGGMDYRFTFDGSEQSTPEGVAHFLEHKQFDMPDGNVLQSLTANGAMVNAFTSSSMTAYHFECSEHFFTNLRTLLSFVTTPYYTPESVAKEQGIINQEIQMVADRPLWRVYYNLLEGLYHNHPIRTPVAGSSESISRITHSILSRCHSAFYRADNMVLCVVGDLDPQRVLATARMVVPPAKGPAAARMRIQEPCAVRHSVQTETMSVAAPTFLAGWKAASAPEETLKQSLIGDLAGDLLCGSSSPLYQKLYQQGLIDRSFSTSFETQPDAAFLAMGGDSSNPEAVVQAIVNETARIRKEGIPEDSFRRTLRSCYGSRVGGLNSFDHTCLQLSRWYFRGYDYYQFPQLYQQITVEDVLRFLDETVVPERMTLSTVVPPEN